MGKECNQAKEKYHLSIKERILVILYGIIGILIVLFFTSILKNYFNRLLDENIPLIGVYGILYSCVTCAFTAFILSIAVCGFLYSCAVCVLIVFQHDIKSKSNLSIKERGMALFYMLVSVSLLILTTLYSNDYNVIKYYYVYIICFTLFIPFLYLVGCEVIIVYQQRKIAIKEHKLASKFSLFSSLVVTFCVMCIIHTYISFFFYFLLILYTAILYPIFYLDFWFFLVTKEKGDRGKEV